MQPSWYQIVLLNVVRRGRLKLFGHLERKSGGRRRRGIGAGVGRHGQQCVIRSDMKLLGLHPEWAIFGICRGT